MLIQLKPIRIAFIGVLLLFVGNLSAQTIKGNVSDKSGEPVNGDGDWKSGKWRYH